MNQHIHSRSIFTDEEDEGDADRFIPPDFLNQPYRAHPIETEDESDVYTDYSESPSTRPPHRPHRGEAMDPWQRHVRDGRTASSVHTRSTDLSAGSRSAQATAGEVPKDGGDMADIYKELQDINDKMKREFKILHERDQVLKERDRALSEGEVALATAKASLEMTIDIEVRRRVTTNQQEHRAEVERLDQVNKEKAKENKRLKDSFDTLKVANDTLRKELDILNGVHEKLEKQASTLQGRLTNLQRKAEHDQRRDDNEFLPRDLGKVKRQKDMKANKQNATVCVGTHDVLAVLLEWVSEVHLRHAITDQPTKPLDTLCSADAIHSRCLKLLPSLVEILKDVASTGNAKLILPCLQFIYWSLVHLDSNQSHQAGQPKVNLSSTLRRLGEDLYKSRLVRFAEDETGTVAPPPIPPHQQGSDKRIDKEGVFFRSPNLHIRLLSSLIILTSPLQVDHLAHVFEVLRADLKMDTSKQLFLHYQATKMLVPFLRPSNKALLQAVVDVYLGMAMDSPALSGFLEACSTEAWFRAISMVMRMPNMEEKIIEKLSILLQKLSKIKTNKRYFEVFGLTLATQDLLRSVANSENAFLTLNLKSILFNLNQRSTTAASST